MDRDKKKKKEKTMEKFTSFIRSSCLGFGCAYVGGWIFLQHSFLMCLTIGTPKTIYFSLGSDGKLMVLGIPVVKQFRVKFGLGYQIILLRPGKG